MKIQVKLESWYAKGNIPTFNFLESRLLTRTGQQCCLGFACEAHGVPRENLLEIAVPVNVEGIKDFGGWMVSGGNNSELAQLAMALNDGHMDNDWDNSTDWHFQDLPTRMGNLITIFAEGGDELEFI